MYSKKINDALKSADISIGDIIHYECNDLCISGILMPNSNNENYLKLKLDSGYNVGLKFEGASIKKESTPIISNKEILKEKTFSKNAKHITLITTGGTIASKVDYKTGAVSAKMDADEFLSMYPGIESLANINVISPLNVLSEEMTPNDWSLIAKCAKQAVDDGSDGVVITHGTDTMGYSASALSYALGDIGVPVILTGSQRSLDRPSSDAHQNMRCSIHACLSDLAGVHICMHASTNDDFDHLHMGTRVRKTHTSGRWSFKSVGVLPVAKVYPDSKIEFLSNDFQKRKNSKINLKNKFSNNVHLAWSYPGITKSTVLSWSDFDGVVIAGTGFGHITKEVHSSIEELIQSNIPIVMASQCFDGRVMLQTYSTGRQLEDIGVIGNGANWLCETAYVKLCWVLAQTKDMKKIKELMLTPTCNDILSYSRVNCSNE